jgi:predicted metal-binding protein
MSSVHIDLERLCESAKRLGASGAASMSSHGVIIDLRVRLKCMVPLCASYGRNLQCPPNVMSVEEFSKVVSKFGHVVVVQYPIPMDTKFIEQNFKGQELESVRSSDAYMERVSKSEREFVDLLCQLEKEALNMGYRFATALSGGACRLCDECVGLSGEACRHPFKSRPAMEAMGIDVVKTALNAGLKFEMPAKDHPVWTGLLLVD